VTSNSQQFISSKSRCGVCARFVALPPVLHNAAFDKETDKWFCNACFRGKEAEARRIVRRRARRHEGAMIKPEAGRRSVSPRGSEVQLHGYHALRRVFPDVPGSQLVSALAAASDVPTQKRAAKAAQFLMLAAMNDFTHGDAEDVPMPASLVRTRTAMPTLERPVQVTPSASPPPVQPSQLLRTISAPITSDDSRVLGGFARAVGVDDQMDSDEHSCLDPRSEKKVSEKEDVIESDARWRSPPNLQLQVPFPCYTQRDKQKFTYAHRSHHDRDWRGRTLRVTRRYHFPDCDAHLLRHHPSTRVLQALDLAKSEAAALVEATCVPEESSFMDKPSDPWRSMQDDFQQKYGREIKNELGVGVQLERVIPCSPVQEQFLMGCRDGEDMPRAAYHGTRSCNIPSISERGLLIPGNNGVRVQNGSAHGVGIYTAKLGSSMLSRGFCDSNQMFICGVNDSKKVRGKSVRTFGKALHHRHHHRPAATQAGSRMGNLKVHKDGPVRHVGNAMVIFDESRVAPLFVATMNNLAHNPWKAWKAKLRFQRTSRVDLAATGSPNKIGVPQFVGKQQTLIEETGQVVWLPPSSESYDYTEAKHVKRQVVQKMRDVGRRAARDAKQSKRDGHDSV